MLRLDRIISGSGLYTRSEAAALIKDGRVSVGGRAALSGAEKHDPETACIEIDGTPLIYRKYTYIMMNKPAGYVSSTSDSRERTVMELLGERHIKLGLFPAGRLDKDAEGMLIMTNDGDFAHEIMSPTKNVSKKYYVQIDGAIASEDIGAFLRGVTLGCGAKCRPATLEKAPGGAYVTLREGKYHQVKRMMASIGKPVKYLKRIAIGGLALDGNLKPGEYCELTDENILKMLNK